MTRINRAAGLENPLQAVFPSPVISTRAPTTSDLNYPLGQVWIDRSAGQAYVLTAVSGGSSTWALSSPGSSDVDTVTGDSGGAISPFGGDIDLSGGTNITTVGANSGVAGAGVTFNLDDAITLATSVTSPIYTSGAGVDMSILSAAGQDVIMTLGDSAGGNSFIVEALDGTDVFSVDSTGTITFSGLTVTGNFAQTAGTFNVGQDNAANAVNIGGGSTARAIAVGNGSGAHTVAIGQSMAGAITIDTAAGVSIDGATASNFTVTGASADLTLSSVGGSVNIDGSEADAAAISIQASDAAGGIDVDFGSGGLAVDGAGGAYVITSDTASNVGVTGAGIDLTLDSAAGRVVVNGEEAAANAITLLSAAGGIDADAALQINIASSQNAADAIVINASAGGIDITAAGAATEDIDITNTAGSVNIDGGEAAVTNAVRINASAADGGMDIDAGTGGITIDSTGAISIDAAAASNMSVSGAGIDLTLASAAGTVIVNAGEDTADAIYLHADAGTSETIRLHSDQGTGADSIHLESDVGGVTLTSTGLASADAINLNAAAGGVDIDGALEINIASSQAAATAVNIVASDGSGGITLDSNAGVTVGGNLILSDVATQMQMNGGAATDFIGQATLTNGQVTVANTNIAATDRIFLQRSAINASTALGELLTTISAATSFTIESKDLATPGSDETGDQSTVDYVIIRQN